MKTFLASAQFRNKYNKNKTYAWRVTTVQITQDNSVNGIHKYGSFLARDP